MNKRLSGLAGALLRADGRLAARGRLYFALALVVGAALSFALFSPCLEAGWGPLDDHEIALFLGSDRNVPFLELPRRILATEAGAPGAGPRYRPAYYAARLVEASIWGASPEVWYLARLVLFAASVASFLWIVRRRASSIESLALVAFLATYPFWGDIFARLGPAETYGVIGTSLFAIGLVAGLDQLAPGAGRSSPRAEIGAAALVLLGGSLAVGSKENFLVLLAPAALLGVRALRARPRGAFLLGASAGVIAFGIFVAAAVVIGVKRWGHVYVEDVSVGGRGAMLIARARALASPGMLVVPAVVGAALVRLRSRGRDEAFRRLAKAALEYAVAAALLVALYVSQQVFYGADWPRGAGHDARYDFPGVLALPLIAFETYRLMIAVLDALGAKEAAVAWLRCGSVVAAIALMPHRLPARATAERAAALTRGFTEAVEGVAQVCASAPTWPAVLVIRSLRTHEEVLAMVRFLRFYGVTNPIFVKVEDLDPESFPAASLERRILATLERVSAQGGGASGPSEPGAEPWSRFAGPPCFGLGFSGAPGFGCAPVLELR